MRNDLSHHVRRAPPPQDAAQHVAVGMTSLPPGRNRDRTRLFDNQWRPIWDSTTANTPAYAHIATWVHAVVVYPDGSRWVGQFYRCPEGIRGDEYPPLTPEIYTWCNPFLETT
jgi:hypothetical protein